MATSSPIVRKDSLLASDKNGAYPTINNNNNKYTFNCVCMCVILVNLVKDLDL